MAKSSNRNWAVLIFCFFMVASAVWQLCVLSPMLSSWLPAFTNRLEYDDNGVSSLSLLPFIKETTKQPSEEVLHGRQHDEFDLATLKHDRRNKVMWCGPQHSRNVMTIIENDFQYTPVPWSAHPDWDLIYGGYPHCGVTKGQPPFDWEMKTGLNKILNDTGWSNLKPHQIWFPCMGCKHSYCEKNQLCYLLRNIDPSACYVLPDDADRLESQMDGSKLWVLKRDGRNLNLHVGTGVSYIRNMTQIPDTSDGSYLVQPYLEPFLGQGEYQRKAELRAYLAITSVYPLRLYIYPHMWVTLAASVYTRNADVNNKCIHDTHTNAQNCGGRLSVMERQITFEDYANKTNMPADIKESLLRKTRELLAGVIHAATPSIQRHHVNEGIRASGASCFSYMRADVGMTENGEAVIFEINEFPYTNHDAPAAFNILRDSHTELFRMIGLDVPPIYGEDNRSEYEKAHSGQWELLPRP